VRFGLTLPNPFGPSRDSVLTVVRAAERLGFDSVWTPVNERRWDEQVTAMERAGVDLMVLGRRYDDRTVAELEQFADAFIRSGARH
jgi:alkanesulfonate monooxygenase SsuD/methylene tetrahydromethanopterin reductase-like flavin-dependent oxidoreductase (luciferase family)